MNTHDLKKLNPRTLHILFIFLVLVPLFWTYYGMKIHDKGIGGDAVEFIATAYNIQHHGAFSMSASPEPPTQLDAYRPPGYPVFLAAIISIVPELASDDFAWFFDRTPGDPYAPPHFKAIKYVQAFLLMLACFLAHYLVRELTGNRYFAHAAFILTAVHPFLYRYVNRYYSELFAAFLIVLFTTLFYLCVKHRKRSLFIVAGLVLGVLTLTKAQWYYIALPCVGYFVMLGLMDRSSRRTFFMGALLFTLCFSVVIVPWKQRNEAQFGRAFITERAGIALDLRSRYVTMSNQENLASFLYWTRTSTLRDLLPSLMDPTSYANLDRSIGYYRAALHRSGELEAEHPRAVADKMQFNEAAERILTNPWGYVKTLPAITYRGLIDGNLSVFNLAVHALFWIAALSALRRKRWDHLAIFLPMSMLVAFNSLVTHNISRYNGTGTVLLVVGLVAGVHVLVERRKKKKIA